VKTMNNEAVSPVVGVMLMLVVTIIIAAVVSAFAGGMADGTETAPQASIEVTISATGAGMSGDGANMEFKLLSGDPIPTKDLAIITYYTNDDGYTYRHEQTASSEKTDLYGTEDYSGYGVGGGFDYGNYTSVVHLARAPFLSDMRYGYAGGTLEESGGSSVTPNYAPDFGNFTWMTGDIMSTNGDAGTADLLGLVNDGDVPPHEIGDADFGPGSVVDVKILHIPSGKYLYDKEVVVL
jgi:FlaG/FlaF family flagellin (archaellin)